jgi:hypothetical protein
VGAFSMREIPIFQPQVGAVLTRDRARFRLTKTAS